MDEVADLQSIILWFEKVPKKLNQRAMTSDILSVMLAFTAENFVQESYFGKPWAKLAPMTIEERKKAGYIPIRILRRTAGAAGLFGSLFTQVDADNKGFLGVGSNISYAADLQFGTSNMPARPFLPEELEPEMMRTITDLFVGEKILNYLQL